MHGAPYIDFTGSMLYLETGLLPDLDLPSLQKLTRPLLILDTLKEEVCSLFSLAFFPCSVQRGELKFISRN